MTGLQRRNLTVLADDANHLLGAEARESIRAALAEIERLRGLIVDRECEAAEGGPTTVWEAHGEDPDHPEGYWRGVADATGGEVQRSWAHIRYLEGRLAAICDGGAVEECDGR